MLVALQRAIQGTAAEQVDDDLLDAMLSHDDAGQSSVAAVQRGVAALRLKLTKVQKSVEVKARRFSPDIKDTVQYADAVVEGYCFELLGLLHHVRKCHSALRSLRRRTFTAVQYFN